MFIIWDPETFLWSGGMAFCCYRFSRGSSSVQHPPAGFPSFAQAGMREDAGCPQQ